MRSQHNKRHGKSQTEALKFLKDTGKAAIKLQKKKGAANNKKLVAGMLSHARELLKATPGHALASSDLYKGLKRRHKELDMEQKEFLKALKVQVYELKNDGYN